MSKRWYVKVKDRYGWREVKPTWARGDFRSEARARGFARVLARRGKNSVARIRPQPLWRTWLTGDVHISRSAPRAHRRSWYQLRRKLARAARRSGYKWNINSGYRSRAEQQALWNAYLNGSGNLAARPGRSNHERGKAADVSVGGAPVGATARGRRALEAEGLHLPVGGESWHVEAKA